MMNWYGALDTNKIEVTSHCYYFLMEIRNEKDIVNRGR